MTRAGKSDPLLVVLAGSSGPARTVLKAAVLQQGGVPADVISIEQMLSEPRVGPGEVFAALTSHCTEHFDVRRSFVLEVGLTHPWVLSIMDRAVALGYVVELVFVEDEPLDDVPALPLTQVSARRTRALALLPAAVLRASFASIYSFSNGAIALVSQFERGMVVDLPHAVRPEVPSWVNKSLLLPLRFRFSDLRRLRDYGLVNGCPVEWADSLSDTPYVGRLRTLTPYFVPQFVDGRLVLHERAFLGDGPQITAGRGLKIDYRVYKAGQHTPLIEDMGPMSSARKKPGQV